MTEYQWQEFLKSEFADRVRSEISALTKKHIAVFRANPERQSIIEAVTALDELTQKLTPKGVDKK